MSKTALITGASSGIGTELSKLLAKKGYNLILVARSKNKLEDLKAKIEKNNNVKANVILKDLSEQNAVKELYDEVKSKNIAVDVLVNNAGFGDFCEYVGSDIEKQDAMMNVNIKALADAVYYFGADMKKRREGKILNVASIAAFIPGPYMAVYYASKAFVLSFSEAVAKELKEYNVTVTALCPGPTNTGFENAADMKGKSTMFAKLKPVSAKLVAKKGYKGMMKGRRVKFCSLGNAIATFSARFTPNRLNAAFAAWVNGDPRK